MLVLAVSLPLGWFSWKMRQANVQRAAVEAIRQSGGHVQYELWFYSQRYERPPLVWLVNLFGDDFFADPAEITICSDLNDNMVAHLKNLPYLQCLHLGTNAVDEADATRLGELENLKLLCAAEEYVTHADAERIRQALPNCRIEWVKWSPPELLHNPSH